MTALQQIEKIKLLDPNTLLGALYYLAIFLLLAILGARLLYLAVARLLARDRQGMIDRTVASFLSQLGQVGIYLVALIIYAHLIPALHSLGTALLTGVSVASIVVGLAAQSTLGNLIAGISLLLYRPFRLGDQVQVNAPGGKETGVIERLTLGYTVLRTGDNRQVIVPNSTMASQVTINLTTQDPQTVVTVPVRIGYRAGLDRARALLMEIARSHPQVQEVLDCPVTQLGDSGVELSLRARCADPGAAQQVKFDLYEQAKKRFDREGIEIPLPYTNVILKRDGDPRGQER
jgi:small conductance mechanosensitive channel